ncbi:MAG: recombinase family protein, partial [Chloroflexota bacterium]
MSNAAGYIRVSLEEQARDGYSLDAQERAIRAYCEAHGWPLDEVFADRGISGKNIDGRPELRRLLEGAEARAFTHVIVWKLDRLGRKVRDLSDICDRFDRRGIGLVSIQESFDTSTAAGRAFRNMLATMAELERDTIIDYLCPWDRASEREAKAKCATVARVCCGIAGGRSSLLRDSQYGSVSRQPAHI